ncbi:PepSY domain-containing protein [Nostoc ellipsosporum NOK]|nr:PepSY domain-containing protein [Nostoc ellipsosporum NOK]
MPFKKIIGKIHLWLGLASGLIVVFLGITGCILAFEHEIRAFTNREQFVEVESKPFLPPSQLRAIATKALKADPRSIEYRGTGKSAFAYYYDEKDYRIAALNPYSGEVLKVRNMNTDFFRVVTIGHYYLWLPPHIGQPIVASATLIFLVMLITGIILWWPRNKAARKQRFSIKMNVRWRRRNYDLHNVLGFYMSWVAVFLAITGLVMGFQWFARTVYFVSSAGKAMPAHEHPVSDTTLAGKAGMKGEDVIWQQLLSMSKPDEAVSVYLPATNSDALEGAINHRPGTYYNTDYYHYDQYSLKELPATGIYAGRFKDAAIADKIARMNYDIHVGAVLGLPGKILMFAASLIAASLPITGFYIWWGRRKKKRVPVKPKDITLP